MLNHFTYNGHSTAEYGLLVTGVRIFGAPSRKVEKFNVAGRNGDILVDQGVFENYIIQYDIAVVDNFKAKSRDIVNWLLASSGYSRLEDTYDPSCYRMASCYSSIDYVTTALNREGTSTIEFDCKPQRFLVTGETSQTFNSSGTITNPSQMASKPLIRVTGTGSVTIGATEMTIKAVDGYVDIDCETQQCYKGTTNCNNDVQVDEFPQLYAGANSITLDGVTSVVITPRWWEL